MDRISAAGYVLDGNGHRVFADQNLAGGVDGTDVDQVWLTGVQEELMAVLAKAGVAPDAANNALLSAALDLLYGQTALLQSPGWAKFSNGLIAQWFTISIPQDNTPRLFVLPITYPTRHLIVVGTYGASVPPTTGAVGADPYSVSLVRYADSASGGAGTSNSCNFISLGC